MIQVSEKEVCERQIRLIKERLQQEGLSPETIRHLNEKMREYTEEMERINKSWDRLRKTK